MKRNLVSKKTSWSNIDKIVKHHTQNHTITVEEVFVPKNPKEQMHKKVSAFLQQEVVEIIEKRIKMANS